ncbi:outer membrane beta-barrel protein [uncultured Porphyromonas sp.]|uniref:outer membrane beta-barrel protein n=1 Tax=uncultured Porphyromonas sp. TaxID=159274 RepID=UPI0025DC8065|nr:outer membrane beta-barrel protein [uncultured Porphyromonas sp.]
MKKLFTIVLCCLCAQITLLSQIIYSGRVISSEDKAPIPLANIVLLAQDSSFIAGGVTDELGRYSITTEQGKVPQWIRATCIGYEDLLRPISRYPREGAELILEVQTNQLQDVTIRAKRKAFSLKDGAFVANVAAVPSLRNSGSIDNLLNRIPFVQGSDGSFSVLGTGGEATLYLDGQRVQDASILQHLRSQDIASVEVINTPGAQYKASTNSVIKIHTIKKQNMTSLSASQYALLQNRLSTYTGVNVAHSNARAYWSFNAGYSRTAMASGNSDYYSMPNGSGDLLETFSSSDMTYRGDFFMGGLGLNISPAKETNIGFVSNLKVSAAKFDYASEGLIHKESGIVRLNTPYTSQIDSRPYKSTSSLYYNGKIGATSVNVTDEILLGSGTNTSIYDEAGTSAHAQTKGAQRYGMNSLMLSFQTPVKGLKLGYGAELALSFNKNELQQTEQGIVTDVISSTVKNGQTLLGTFVDVRAQWLGLSWYAGLRYEYEASSYTQNGTRITRQKPSPHFLSPSFSLSYSGEDLQSTLSYRKSLNRPAYSSLNNFTLLENQYVYQQSNPFLLNETNDALQLLGTYKTLSFSASYNYIRNTATTALARHETKADVLLKRTINIPSYSTLSLGLNWSDSFGSYSPSIEVGFQKQLLKYSGLTFDRPMLELSTSHYVELGKGWSVNADASYSSRSHSLFSEYSAKWSYSLMLSKEIGNFTFDLSLQNLFLDNKQYRTRRMAGIFAQEIEAQDFSGTGLNVSYRIHSVKAAYRNKKASSEGQRF